MEYLLKCVSWAEPSYIFALLCEYVGCFALLESGLEEDAQGKLAEVSGAFSDALKAAVAFCQTAAAFGKLDSDVIDD